MVRRVVIVGAGIVGCAVAAALQVSSAIEVTVVERGEAGQLLGSTGHAPGFVGLLNETSHLTELARRSATVYEGLAHGGAMGFDRVGGLEVAVSPAAVQQLERRTVLAGDAGLPARLLTPAQAAAYAPELVDQDRCRAGLLFDRDGTARSGPITAALSASAQAGGAHFRHGSTVTGIDTTDGRVQAVRLSNGERLPADDVVLAAGIWGSAVAALAGQRLPLVPVAHPYVYGPPRAGSRSSVPQPFVRWPEHHVYARDHGDRLGLGSYDHQPVPVTEVGVHAEQEWRPQFEAAAQRGAGLLPAAASFHIVTRLNGVFSMTADNQPLVGPFPDLPGLWAAEAVWVTHAAGAAELLARQMIGAQTGGDRAALHALRPGRFDGLPDSLVRREALCLYNDIYAAAEQT